MKKIDAVFYEVEDMIDLGELQSLVSHLPSNFYCLDMYQLEANNSICYAFISPDMAEEIGYEYSGINSGVLHLMNDAMEERKDRCYEYYYKYCDELKSYTYAFIRNSEELIEVLKGE